MSFLRRSSPPGDPTIFVDGQGTIGGRQVGWGQPTDLVGSFTAGRPATAANVAACARFLPQAAAEDFDVLADGGRSDKASGLIYDRVAGDPLLAPDPAALASLFLIAGDAIVFLRPRGVTLADLEREAEQAARERERVEAEHAKFLGRQKQTPFRVSEVAGERVAITVREAARRLLDAGGAISRGPVGELVLSAPGRLTGDMATEAMARQELAACAQVLDASRATVLAALEDAESDRSKVPRRLDERLPDREAAVGGGVV